MVNLKNLRKNKDFSAEEIANYNNIPIRTYRNYENQKTEMPYETLFKLSDYFGCSVDYLLGHQSPNIVQLDSFTPKQQEVLSLIKQMNADQVLEVVGYCHRVLQIPSPLPARTW